MQLAAPSPSGSSASTRLAPLLAALARTTGSDGIHYRPGSPSLADLARSQQLFDVERGADGGWDVRALNAAARDALDGASGAAIRTRIAGTRAKLEHDFPGSSALDSVTLTAGTRPIQFRWGRAEHNRDGLLASTHAAEGTALLVAATQLADSIPASELGALSADDATLPSEWVDDIVDTMREVVPEWGTSTSAVMGGHYLVLGGWDAATFRAPLDATAPRSSRDAANMIGLVSHEALHTVSPGYPDDASYERLRWIEEGGANTLGEWAGQFREWASAFDVPDPGPASPQTDHEYYPMQVAVGRLLALAGFDEQRAEDFRGGSTLLQGGPIEQAPERIATAIAQRHDLDAATRATIADLIAESRADATVIDQVEALALGQASRSTSSV